MSVLLLRLAGPLQAWGSASKFNRRMSEREPTKSGVIGLAASALGRCRNASIDDLACLRFGVRTDQAGQPVWDFHTAHIEDCKDAFVSKRQYLADAVFLAGLEGDEELLRKADQALNCPLFPLFLGRRSCPPTGRVSLGLRTGPLLEVLASEPWQAAAWYRKKSPATVELEIVHDAVLNAAGAFIRRDQPKSFSQEYRRYEFRSLVANRWETVKENPDSRLGSARPGIPEPVTSHDPMSDLEDDDVPVKG